MPLYTFRCPAGDHDFEDLCKATAVATMCPDHPGVFCEKIMSTPSRPKFGTGVKGHYSREANEYVRSKPYPRD